MLEKAGNFHDLRLAARQATGSYRGPLFMDSDLYKWLEAVAYALGATHDAELERMADETVDLIAAAQQPDGYLNSYYQVLEPGNRWANLAFGHELYCAGHLIQAALALRRATGKDRLLAVALRLADHICSVFGPGRRNGTPGHPEIEMALVELYRETRDRRYLDLSSFFLDQRGRGLLGTTAPGGPGYFQDRVPIREARAIEGHAVRALYLACGVADAYLETGEQALLGTAASWWQDMTSAKMYVTGGVGARERGEAFGESYELPNDTAYCETCAAVASIMWNWRLLLATGEAQYADLMERTLFNGFLSGVSLDGRRFFYVNPLLSRRGSERQAWYDCACCPPNVMRLLASFGHYVATADETGVQLHQYVPSSLACSLTRHEQTVLKVETAYPWQGRVDVAVEESGASPWELALRVPSWCLGCSLEMNGHRLDVGVTKGYARIQRVWQRGDVLTLELTILPRLVQGHPRIDATRGCVAIERGPLVYCLEQQAQETDVPVLDVKLDASIPLAATWREDLLGGVMAVRAGGQVNDTGLWGDRLYRPFERTHRSGSGAVTLTATPYYAWSNLGAGQMRVWIPVA